MSGQLRIELNIGGQTLSQLGPVPNLRLETMANQPSRLWVTLTEQRSSQGKFSLADNTRLKVGGKVTLKLGYEGDGGATEVFRGKIVSRAFKVDSQGMSVELNCACSAIGATEGVLNKAMAGPIKDEVLIRNVLKQAGITLGKVADGLLEHKQMVLPPVNAWQFVRQRVAANACVLISRLGKVEVVRPALTGVKHTLQLEIQNILGLQLLQDGRHQVNSIALTAWQIASQSMGTQALKAAGSQAGAAGKALGRGRFRRVLDHCASPAVFAKQAEAEVLARELDFRRGTVIVPGRADIEVGQVLSLQKLPTSVAGDYWVSGVCHVADGNGWRTEVTLGLPYHRFFPEASGYAQGVMLATVEPYKDDPEKLLRLPVKLQGLQPDSAVLWARLGTPLAGKDRGWFALPQPGDEVVIGFIGGHHEEPVILASVHNPKRKPPYPYGKEAYQHGLVLEKSLHLTLNSQEKSALLATGDKTSLALSDAKGIEAKRDKASLALLDGVTVSNPGKTTKIAAQKIQLDSKSTVDIKVAQFVNVQ
ncbi:phage baseplate assembly protein V [Parachitinimonas caeni]|uniref:Phage baseplate assembly protein V n=1 Tax=Parachitinimonas caeni TaxID=3031301 RepID=A0ABT7DZP1_9NEIS|nr:phage baseplate assembly protein V [Parachitinimonas caeni]MDK2125459.1 phage baseplate assembly protein V [Parachitinimonas caeni]